MQHYVEWGGRRKGIQLDRSFKGFTNVLFATNNADDGSGFNQASKTASYRAGDQPRHWKRAAIFTIRKIL